MYYNAVWSMNCKSSSFIKNYSVESAHLLILLFYKFKVRIEQAIMLRIVAMDLNEKVKMCEQRCLMKIYYRY